MVRINVTLSFCLENHFNTNHWGRGINLLFLPSPNLDPLSFLPLHTKSSHTFKIQGQKVSYWCILCFHQRKHSTNIQLLLSNLFTNFNLGTSHNNQLSMGTHNKINAEWCSTQQSTGSECIIFFYSKCSPSKIVYILWNNFK